MSKSHDTERDRILAVPRWTPPDPTPDLTEAFRRPGGTMKAWPIQSQVWYTAWRLRREYPDRPYGMLVSAGVGVGKTLMSYVLPLAAGLRRPVLLVPAKLEQKTHRDFSALRPHWKDPPPITVLTYEMLSSPRASGILERLRPDGIICDECHRLKASSATRTKRVLRYWRDNPLVRWYMLSGTLVDSELQDVVHLSEMALREFSPAPRLGQGFQEVMAWAQVLNVGGTPGPADYGFFKKIHDTWSPTPTAWNGTLDQRRESCRAAYSRRYEATPGGVLSHQSSYGGSLVITVRRPSVPRVVQEALDHVEETWSLPDGSAVFTNPLEVHRALCEISTGFYYRWAWESLGLNGPDQEWIDARGLWGRTMRAWLGGSHLPPEGLDSEALVSRACRDGDPRVPADVVRAWRTWAPISRRWTIDYDRREGPQRVPVVPVWLSEFIVDDALAWAATRPEPPILWYDYRAIEDAFRRRGRGVVEVFGRDREPPQGPGSKAPRVPSALSLTAHGEGKNLQYVWGDALYLRAFANGKVWEQSLGRLARSGQPRDEVTVAVNAHTAALKDSLRKGRDRTKFIQDMNRSPQLFLGATWIDD